ASKFSIHRRILGFLEHIESSSYAFTERAKESSREAEQQSRDFATSLGCLLRPFPLLTSSLFLSLFRGFYLRAILEVSMMDC
ncbi:hypothetical protein SDJN02_11199, partial [Cucurbita argyrosperma subsp. argyrosperma]